MIKRYQFTQGMWLEDPGMTKFLLILRKISRSINLLKAYGPRSQA